MISAGRRNGSGIFSDIPTLKRLPAPSSNASLCPLAGAGRDRIKAAGKTEIADSARVLGNPQENRILSGIVAPWAANIGRIWSAAACNQVSRCLNALSGIRHRFLLGSLAGLT